MHKTKLAGLGAIAAAALILALSVSGALAQAKYSTGGSPTPADQKQSIAQAPVFRDFDVARAAAATLASPESLGGSRLLAWVLMPDHLHLLLQLGEAETLAVVVSRIKARSATAANRAGRRRGAVWGRGFHDHAVRRDEDLRVLAGYIVANPLRAGLARGCGAYPFWDAAWLQ